MIERVCENCGKVFKTFPSLRTRKHVFCSHHCFYEYRKKKPKICVYCNKEFIPNHSSQRYCSHHCAMKDNNPMRNPILVERLRETFESRIKGGFKGRRHSLETRKRMSAIKKDKPRPKEVGKKVSETRKRLIKEGKLIPPMLGKSLSSDEKKKLSEVQKRLWNDPLYAQRIVRSQNRRPTKLEQRVMSIIDTNNLPFRYVGNGKFWIAGKNPDFVHLQENLLIEVFGNYWHEVEDETKLKQHYGKHGYDLIVIWENELSNEENVSKKLTLRS